MTRFVSSAVLVAALTAAAVPAFSQTPRLQRADARQAVMICASDVLTRRAYEREHGATPVFVTARQAIEARRNGETWETPRCMTEREYNRLIATTATRAAL